jgi:hypothetical protein
MLLEIDNAELVHMLEDQTSLKGKVGLNMYFLTHYFQYSTMRTVPLVNDAFFLRNERNVISIFWLK